MTTRQSISTIPPDFYRLLDQARAATATEPLRLGPLPRNVANNLRRQFYAHRRRLALCIEQGDLSPKMAGLARQALDVALTLSASALPSPDGEGLYLVMTRTPLSQALDQLSKQA